MSLPRSYLEDECECSIDVVTEVPFTDLKVRESEQTASVPRCGDIDWV